MPDDPVDELLQPARFRAMGTDVEVFVLGPAGSGERAGKIAAGEIERLEAKWSRFRATSELCHLNDAGSAPVVVSPETFALIEHAIDAWRATNGRYDPTILPALVAAGYDRDFDTVPRDAEAPAAVPSAAPGCADIVLDPLVRAVRLPDGVALDLGGIGKGYAADLVAEALVHDASLELRGALVNLGGDLRAEGEAPARTGWVVAVDDPLATGRTGVLAIARGAVATSTRLRRAWQRDGKPLHHLIDPRTGVPAQSGLASVTVIADQARRAEVLAKAAFVAGVDDGAALIAGAGATGLMVTDGGDVLELEGVAAFRP